MPYALFVSLAFLALISAASCGCFISINSDFAARVLDTKHNALITVGTFQYANGSYDNSILAFPLKGGACQQLAVTPHSLLASVDVDVQIAYFLFQAANQSATVVPVTYSWK